MTMYWKRSFELCSALLISFSSAVLAAPIWNAQYGDAQVGQYAGDIALFNNSPIIIGSFNGDINFGGGPLPSAGETDVYIARLDSNGGYVWAKRFGDFDQQNGTSIAVGRTTGDIVAAGDFFGSIDFGGGILMGQMGGSTVFLAKFDINGNHKWSKAFPGGQFSGSQAFSTAVDHHDNILLAGQFGGTIDFGCGPLVSAGNMDIFVAKFSKTTGSCLWSQRFGDYSQEYATAVAVDSQNDVILGGGFWSSVDFGNGVHVAGNGTSGYIAKFDADGNVIWDIDSGSGSYYMGVTDIQVNNIDEILATGFFSDQITFGGPVMISAAGSIDAYVTALKPTGQHLWSQRYGDAGYQQGRAIAVNDIRHVFITGGCTSSMSPAALSCSGWDDVYAIELDEFGNYVSGSTYGDQAYQSGAAIAVTGRSRFVLGEFRGALNFGLGSMFALGPYNQDVFLVKFSP